MMKLKKRNRSTRGLTLVEMVIVATLLIILAAAVTPVARYSVRRSKELQLSQGLREMRNAIDEYKRYSDAGLIPIDLGTDGYPQDLESLLEPIELVGQVDRQARFLRRIPVDPMVGSNEEWILLSTQDDPESTSWGGENVFDVRSSSAGVGLNGVPYAEW